MSALKHIRLVTACFLALCLILAWPFPLLQKSEALSHAAHSLTQNLSHFLMHLGPGTCSLSALLGLSHWWCDLDSSLCWPYFGFSWLEGTSVLSQAVGCGPSFRDVFPASLSCLLRLSTPVPLWQHHEQTVCRPLSLSDKFLECSLLQFLPTYFYCFSSFCSHSLQQWFMQIQQLLCKWTQLILFAKMPLWYAQ